MSPQKERLLRLLKSREERGVLPIEALIAVGTFRLAARIAELRDDGYLIETIMTTLPNRTRVARYVLRGLR